MKEDFVSLFLNSTWRDALAAQSGYVPATELAPPCERTATGKISLSAADMMARLAGRGLVEHVTVAREKTAEFHKYLAEEDRGCGGAWTVVNVVAPEIPKDRMLVAFERATDAVTFKMRFG